MDQQNSNIWSCTELTNSTTTQLARMRTFLSYFNQDQICSGLEQVGVGSLDQIAYAFYSQEKPHKKEWASFLLKSLPRRDYMILTYLLQVYTRDNSKLQKTQTFE